MPKKKARKKNYNRGPNPTPTQQQPQQTELDKKLQKITEYSQSIGETKKTLENMRAEHGTDENIQTFIDPGSGFKVI